MANNEKEHQPKRQNTGYEIVHNVDIGNKHVVVGYRATAPAPYVTWELVEPQNYFYQGHYFTSEQDAIIDMIRRAGEELDLGDRSLALELLTDDDRIKLRKEREYDDVCYALDDRLANAEQSYDREALLKDPLFLRRAVNILDNIDHSQENEAIADAFDELLDDFPEYITKGQAYPGYDESSVKISPEEAELLNSLLQHPSAKLPDIYGPFGDNFCFDFVSDSGSYSGRLELIPSNDPKDPNKLSQTEPPHAILTVWNSNTGDQLSKTLYTAKQLNETLTGDYGIRLQNDSHLEFTLIADESLRRLGNTFVYHSNAEDERYTRHNGEICTVKRGLTPKECDVLITGLMWEAEFPDGDLLHVFDEELISSEAKEKKPSLNDQIHSASSRLSAAEQSFADRSSPER